MNPKDFLVIGVGVFALYLIIFLLIHFLFNPKD